jgi:hypothetical protein
MRTLAFAVVFVAHSMPFNVLPGGFGVTIFFFLSGYLITTLLRGEAERTSSPPQVVRSGHGASGSKLLRIAITTSRIRVFDRTRLSRSSRARFGKA